jgi:hypothetical protein
VVALHDLVDGSQPGLVQKWSSLGVRAKEKALRGGGVRAEIAVQVGQLVL